MAVVVAQLAEQLFADTRGLQFESCHQQKITYTALKNKQTQLIQIIELHAGVQMKQSISSGCLWDCPIKSKVLSENTYSLTSFAFHIPWDLLLIVTRVLLDHFFPAKLKMFTEGKF